MKKNIKQLTVAQVLFTLAFLGFFIASIFFAFYGKLHFTILIAEAVVYAVITILINCLFKTLARIETLTDCLVKNNLANKDEVENQDNLVLGKTTQSKEPKSNTNQ